ncbi:recombinase family protein [Peribacillus tepidiphilus]|uniref:recombinase family protein n=1 Tax=Peribacillus tepidiphilus TaxID=2652445 RepID=UPI003B846350
MYLNGTSLWKITAYLRSQNIKTKKGKDWHDNTIRRMLSNEIYIGKIVYGKQRAAVIRKIRMIKENNLENLIVSYGL